MMYEYMYCTVMIEVFTVNVYFTVQYSTVLYGRGFQPMALVPFVAL